MKALVFDRKALHFETKYPDPIPAPGEALIKVIMAGICNTDIEITKGYKNFSGIPGHEFVGKVVAVRSQNQSLLHKRVVGEINCACKQHSCDYCRQNLERHCPHRKTLGIAGHDGTFAEYITLPIENLHEVPDYIPDKIATLTEPLAAAFEVLEQVRFNSETEVLIVGDGKLGLLIHHAVATSGAKITHVGKHSEKIDLVRHKAGKTILLNKMPHQQYDVVIEAAGNARAINFALQHTKPRGVLVLKSTVAQLQTIDLNYVVVNEITIIGSRCGLFKPALDYLKTGVDLSQLISHVFPFDQALKALNFAAKKGSLKVLLQF